MKEQIIQLPDNFEVKEIKDGKIILVEKEKKPTYEDIAEKLFKGKHSYFIDNNGTIVETDICNCFQVNYSNNCTSRRQAEKLLAINKLMNVAKYLNDGWQPNWNNGTRDSKYYIYYSNWYDQLSVNSTYGVKSQSIYFKTKELAEQAIKILGEETIRLALCTDY